MWKANGWNPSAGVRAGWRTVAGSVLLAGVHALGGCSPASCEELRFERADYYEKCGRPLTNEDMPDCSQLSLEIYQCELGCFEGASCAALHHQDLEGAAKFDACNDYCSLMADAVLSSGPKQ